MRKSTIWLLAGVMIFAFLGLLYLQASYVHIILSTQADQFREAVKRSLYQVSHDLELDETSRFLDDQLFAFSKKYLGKDSKSSNNISRIIHSDQQRLSVNSDLSAKIELNPAKSENSQELSFSPSFGKSDVNRASQAIQETLIESYFYHQNILDEVIRSAMKSSEKAIEDRIDFKRLEYYIKTELANNNLALPFSFAVLDSAKKIVYQSESYGQEENQESRNVYSQILFPKDPVSKLYTLQVIFPTQKKYMFDSVSFIVPSIVFTFVLMIIFIFTIAIVFRQKRLSEMKTDFINNMTHELKTPVASISLAAQTLNDAEVNNSPQLMNYAKTVITDESKRLGFLVEKVLQMSLFDDGATQFKMVELDANDLIASIANTFALRVENSGGTIDIELDALESTILVDKLHFTNVLFNLMENAVKYRREDVALELIAKTANVNNQIQITIQDNGIGIKKDNVKKIFERFYRVHTGNRHDVKGFGLGLAYVKRIINELNGTIKVDSEYGVGTKFIITLPYVNNQY